MNTYAYVGGNPIRYSDPLGLLFDPVYNGACAGSGCHWPANVIPPLFPNNPVNIESPGQNPVSHGTENEILQTPVPGFPEDPKDYCPKIKRMLGDLEATIKWRKLDRWFHIQQYGPHHPSVISHNERIKNLTEKRDQLQKKHNDFCKDKLACDSPNTPPQFF